MAKGKKRIYRCQCGHCFSHEDKGSLVVGICPHGTGTYCTDITEEEFYKEKKDGRVSPKK